MIYREDQGEALQLLVQADVVVVCSHPDGWNLIAVEACVVGPETQRLILSEHVGAVELAAPVAEIIQDPSDLSDLTASPQSAIENGPHAGIERRSLRLPTTGEWWVAIRNLHDRSSRT